MSVGNGNQSIAIRFTESSDMTESSFLRDTILELAKSRGSSKSICPSEAARHVGGQKDTDWRELMTPVHAEAVQLAKEGVIQILQKGVAVDPDTFSGVYRIQISDGSNV